MRRDRKGWNPFIIYCRGNKPITGWIEGWLVPRAGFDTLRWRKVSCICPGIELRFIRHPSHSLVAVTGFTASKQRWRSWRNFASGMVCGRWRDNSVVGFLRKGIEHTVSISRGCGAASLGNWCRRFETEYWRGATSQKDVNVHYIDTELNKASNARVDVILRRARLSVSVTLGIQDVMRKRRIISSSVPSLAAPHFSTLS
jgi:hypothetical protein